MRSLPVFPDLRAFLAHLAAAGDLARIGQPVDITFTDDEAWRTAISGITINHVTLTTPEALQIFIYGPW